MVSMRPVIKNSAVCETEASPGKLEAHAVYFEASMAAWIVARGYKMEKHYGFPLLNLVSPAGSHMLFQKG